MSLGRQSSLYSLVAVFVVLPLAGSSCGSSDSIGALGHGGSGGSGSGGQNGTGGAGTDAAGTTGGGGALPIVDASGIGGVVATGGVISAGGVGGGPAGAGGAAADGQGGPDAAADAYQCPPLTDVYCAYGYAIDSHGCAACALAPIDAAGTGGNTSSDGGKPDAPAGSDAEALATLCTATGGQLDTGLCCASVGDFPNQCLDGACGCSPSNSHTVVTCACPSGGCFSPTVGCSSGGGGAGGTVVDGGKGGVGGGAGGESATGGRGGSGGATATGGSLGGTAGTIGGGCSYREIPGIGTVTSITDATTDDGLLCSGSGKVVSYSFAADDGSLSPSDYDVSKYGYDANRFQRLRIPDSSQHLPNEACLTLVGVAVGSTFTIVRAIITSGSCAPAVDNIDNPLASCVGTCN